ncbi:MAG TPA: hypothetical protein VMT76_08340 [Puia sp.]|nr:hypothetical protein [Puia sp.]
MIKNGISDQFIFSSSQKISYTGAVSQALSLPTITLNAVRGTKGQE